MARRWYLICPQAGADWYSVQTAMSRRWSTENLFSNMASRPDHCQVGCCVAAKEASMRDSVSFSTMTDQYIDQLFLQARTHSAWLDQPVPPHLLQKLYAMTAMGPTSANCSPLRVVFVCSPQAKERLLPHMAAGNREKTRQAPVTAILAYDLDFPEQLATLYPHEPSAPSWFTSSADATRIAALRNGSLQGG